MKDTLKSSRRDTRVLDSDVRKFLNREIALKSLEIDEGAVADQLSELRSQIFVGDLERVKFSSNLSSEDDLREMISVIEDLDDLSYEKIVELLKIIRISGLLYRYDYNRKVIIPFEKEYLRSVLVKFNKTKIDELYRKIDQDLSLKDFRPEEIDSYARYSELKNIDVMVPSLQEVLDDLTEDQTTQNLIAQILLEIAYDYRLENRLIVLSGAESRKDLFKSLVVSVSDDRVVTSTLKSLDKKSLVRDRISARAVFISSEINHEHQIYEYLKDRQSVFITDESDFKGAFPTIEIPFDRNEIDEVDTKESVIKTVKFRNSVLKELEEYDHQFRLNRVLRSSNHLNQRLNEFVTYLREISILGREELPSSVLYALYQDFCSFRRLKPEFSSQLSFTRDLSKILSEHKYYLSDKSERAKSVLNRSEITNEFISDLASTNLRFKEVIDTNKISKVYKLRLDVKELNERLVERRLYKVSKLKALQLSENFVEKCQSERSESLDVLTSKIESLISHSVKNSAFRSYELISFLSRNLFLDCQHFNLDDPSSLDISFLKTQISDLKLILDSDMSASLKSRLIEDQFDKLRFIEDLFERSMKVDEFDAKLLKMLEDQSDFRSMRMLNEFRKTIDFTRKDRLRLQMIDMLCKEVKVI